MKKKLVIFVLRSSRDEFPFASTNIQTETDYDNDYYDEDDAEDPHKENVGSIISVLDGRYHLLLKPDPDWN